MRELFYQYFDVITDEVAGVMDEALKLRYQVYCLEQGFEDASRFPDGRESDGFDGRSVHSIVRHLNSGLTAATVRLVLPDPKNPDTLFPIEENCASSIQSAASLMQGVPRAAIAEISRFAVSKEFKRRLGEKGTVAGIGPDPGVYVRPDPKKVRQLPHLILGLFVAIVKMSAQHNVTHWYAVMDMSLLRLLNRFGIRFVPLGEQVDYHGFRQPCFGSIDEVLAGIWEKRPDIWQLITADGSVWPAPESATRDACARV